MLHIIHTHTELAVDFLLHLRRARPVAFVGNRNVPPTLLRALFGSQVVHVKAPPSDAYQTLDSLHAELLHVLEGGKGGGGGWASRATRETEAGRVPVVITAQILKSWYVVAIYSIGVSCVIGQCHSRI